jgi:hypothetical protein
VLPTVLDFIIENLIYSFTTTPPLLPLSNHGSQERRTSMITSMSVKELDTMELYFL